MSESHFQLVTREGIERDISEAQSAGDSNLVNDKLAQWPYGRERPSISEERAHDIARLALVGPDVFQMEAG